MMPSRDWIRKVPESAVRIRVDLDVRGPITGQSLGKRGRKSGMNGHAACFGT